MNVKVTFVGTSHGIPMEDRYCACTMLESGEAIYFVDGGAPVIHALLQRGLDPRRVRAIFTTHVHSDHTMGLLHYIDLVDWVYKEHTVDLFLTEQRWMDGVLALHNGMSTAPLDTNRIHMHVIDPATTVYEDENVKVQFIPTKHLGDEHPSNAILITAGDKKLLFSGDLSYGMHMKDFPTVACEEETDLFVCEFAHGLTFDNLGKYFDACKTKRLYFHHVWPMSKLADIEAAKEKYPFEVVASFDGLEIEI